MQERRTACYRGTVQGVGFRYSVSRIAQGFAVQGYVKNLPDGRVELLAEGGVEELDRFMAEVARAFEGMIAGVDVQRSAASGDTKGFSIRY